MIRGLKHTTIAGIGAILLSTSGAFATTFQWGFGQTFGQLDITFNSTAGSLHTYDMTLQNTSSDLSVLTGFSLDVDPNGASFSSTTSAVFSQTTNSNNYPGGVSFDFCFENDANNSCFGNDPNAQVQPAGTHIFQMTFDASAPLTFLSAGSRWQRTGANGNGSLKLVDDDPDDPGNFVVPVPASLPLLLAGIAGFGIVGRRKARKSA